MATPATSATNDPAAAMVWEEARRLIVRQEAVLDTLRVQAVAILSVSSIVAGLFGAHLLPTHPSGLRLAAILVALVLFGVTVFKVIVILTPRDWTFEHALTEKLAQLETGKQLLKAGSFAYTWAKEAEASRTTNQVELDHLMEYFRWACILTAAQVVVWGLALL
jgi:hypothetical protein